MHNELRCDYILKRYSIIASSRIKRPTDFTAVPQIESKNTCPFCPGNEQITPPADLLIVPFNDGTVYDKDGDTQRRSDWLVRCFSNLYPATENVKELTLSSEPLRTFRLAYGYHEVIVESPNHGEHPSVIKVKQLQHSLEAELHLMRRFLGDERIKYIQLFRNHRKEAGASLSHPHSQIIALDFVPPKLNEELIGYDEYRKESGNCVYCKIIEKERSNSRKVFENEDFFVLAPWASITPFELWIIPKHHKANLLEISKTEIYNLSKTLRSTLGAIAKLLGDPPYNYSFHTSPKGINDIDYHWHLEIYPKLSIWAGFELSTGVYINVTPPEVAASSLCKLLKEEWESID